MRLHRQTFLALLAAICGGTLVPSTASAVGRYEPKCDAPRPTCEAQPSCEAPPKKCEPCQPPPAAPVYVQPPGMFVQPQGSGPVRGPVEQSGVEGATITFPELQLRMPSIRFPGRSRYRENARMELNPASAPYVEAPAAPLMAAPAAPMAAAPMAAPMMAPMQAPIMQAPMMAAAPVMQAPMMAPMMQAPMYVPAAPYYAPPAPPPQAPPQQAPPQYAPPSCAPPSYAPQCDGQAVGQLDPLEEKLRRIEAAERRLHAQTLELQRLMQQMPSAMTGGATPQNSIPLRPVGPTTLRPAEVHQPLTPPQPPPDLGRRPVVPPQAAPALAAPAFVAPHGQYPARPAGFYAEPIPAAPRTIVQPAVTPMASQVIREPSVPRGQITRLQ